MSRDQPLATVRSSSKRPGLMWLNGAILAGLAVFWWRNQTLPRFGGGEAESDAARNMKAAVYASVSPDEESGFARLDVQNPGGWLLAFSEPLQPLDAYQNQNPIRPTAARRTLVIQPLEPLTKEQKALLPALKDYTQACFQLPVRIAPPLDLTASALPASAIRGNGSRAQRDAGALLDAVLAPRLPSDAVALFGVTGSDLWASDLQYVFGLGDFNRRVGVYSLCRYFPEFRGKKRRAGDDTRALKRACRVLNHEIGHVFGMTHCVFYKCSMNGANSLAESDAQPMDYCPVCHRKMQWNIGWNGDKRFADLERFYVNHKMPQEAQWFEARRQHWNRVAARQGIR